MSTPSPDHSPLLGIQAPAESSFRRRRFIFQVKNDILTAREAVFLKYESIEPSIGSRAALSLDSDGEIEARSVLINYNSVTQVFTVDMPTAIPSCHQPWISDEFIRAGVVSGFLTLAENYDISMSSNTRFNTFAAPYQMSFAVPNLYLEPSGFPLPTIVFVSGFSQLYPYLLMQKDVWLIGGAAHVNIVFILKWSQDIFPRPLLGTPPQEITIRRDELCGNAIPTGRKSSDVWRLSLERLRYRAEQAIRGQGYVPA
ncbi:hypothetical protein Aspvir_010098 [Aspergillus viridinutans]|uniref:Uncharacterized protein n=1 Tax=Aspergillus viridinutans TaxID=75553 RepID=A0A9P3F9G1_ASPVI|nr:uncharacterized protein Aspvir_010098 [Aspergillus viridinutans]GIK05981.1 hypothetical protein Aspvir_010098 [Aspergillus viridinutans]